MFERFAELLARVFGKLRQLHVADAVGEHTHVAHALNFDDLAHEGQIHRDLRRRTENANQHLRLRFAAQAAHDAVERRARVHGLAIDAHNDVAAQDPRAFAGRTDQRSDDHGLPFSRLDLDPDPAEFADEILLEFLIVLRLEKLRVRIERLHHAVQRRTRQLIVSGRLRVDVIFAHELHHLAQVTG